RVQLDGLAIERSVEPDDVVSVPALGGDAFDGRTRVDRNLNSLAQLQFTVTGKTSQAAVGQTVDGEDSQHAPIFERLQESLVSALRLRARLGATGSTRGSSLGAETIADPLFENHGRISWSCGEKLNWRSPENAAVLAQNRAFHRER